MTKANKEKEEKEKKDRPKIDGDTLNLVIARLKAIPPNIYISLGDEGSFSVEELIERVKALDDVGRKIVEIQLEYLRSLGQLPIEQNDPSSN